MQEIKTELDAYQSAHSMQTVSELLPDLIV